jgi:hypothetical protein
MTYMNSPGLSHSAVFMERILALNTIESLDRRKEQCSHVTKSPRESYILKYLIQAPFWPEMVQLAERALYSDLHYSNIMDIRTHSREGDVRSYSVFVLATRLTNTAVLQTHSQGCD